MDQYVVAHFSPWKMPLTVVPPHLPTWKKSSTQGLAADIVVVLTGRTTSLSEWASGRAADRRSIVAIN
tara:strand:- start:578 stop:781 length:204 start_codon:yes stop_codon:yes gene_type:complete